MNREQYQTYSLQIISIIMLLYFFYNWSNKPLTHALLLWSTMVVATPVPNASILLSFPAKIFFNIPLYVSQNIASVMSILFIGIFPFEFHPQLLKKIIKQNAYHVIIISIISSVLIANVIDDMFMEHISYLKIIVSIILLMIYFLSIK